jgi:hypothetical protein
MLFKYLKIAYQLPSDTTVRNQPNAQAIGYVVFDNFYLFLVLSNKMDIRNQVTVQNLLYDCWRKDRHGISL